MATVIRPPIITQVPINSRRPAADNGPASNLLLTTLKSKDLFFTVAGDGPFYDYPTPPERQYPLSMRTFLQPLNLNLRSKDQFFTAAGKAPTYDYPTPPERSYSIGMRTFLQPLNLNILGKDKFFTAAGKGPTYDYPTPPNPVYPLPTRTWTQSVNLNILGKDKFFAAAGEAPCYDYPTPPARPAEARTWTLPSNIALFTSLAAPVPFNQDDWPAPQSRPTTRDLLTWLQNIDLMLLGQDQFFTVAGDGPWYDYPVPPSRKWTDNLSSISPINLNLTMHLLPFSQKDWSTPQGRARNIDLQTWIDQYKVNLFVILIQSPFVQLDWPLPPLSRPASIELKTWLDSLKLNLRSKDKFYGAAGQPPQNLEWPTPKARARNIELHTFIDELKIQLQGKDSFFNGPGRGPRYDWPTPPERQYSNELRTFLDQTTLNLLGQIVVGNLPDSIVATVRGYLNNRDINGLLNDRKLMAYLTNRTMENLK